MRKLPSSWDEISVGQFMELKAIDPTTPTYERYIQILSILLDVSDEDEMWDEMEFSDLNDMIHEIYWIKTEPLVNGKGVQIGEFTPITINEMSLGTWIDLNHFFADIWGNLDKIIAILYRRTELDSFSNIKFEPYSYPLEARAERFKSLSISGFYWLISEFLDFKSIIVTTFSSHFNPIIEEDTDYEPDEEDIEEEKLEELANNWAWESLLWRISGNDLTKYDAILDLPVILVMNHISHLKDIKSW